MVHFHYIQHEKKKVTLNLFKFRHGSLLQLVHFEGKELSYK